MMLSEISKRTVPRLVSAVDLRTARFLWRQGFNTKRIADALGVSEAAVYNSLQRIKGD
jgi:predicted transcriptional regulator